MFQKTLRRTLMFDSRETTTLNSRPTPMPPPCASSRTYPTAHARAILQLTMSIGLVRWRRWHDIDHERAKFARAQPVAPIGWAATYAAIVASASLIVAMLAYRSGAPKLRPSTHLHPGDAANPASLVIVVKNMGRALGELGTTELNVPGPHTISLGVDRGPALASPSLAESVPLHSTRQ